MLTQKDISLLKTIFVTKEEFEIFKEEMRSLRNEMITLFSEVMGELKAIREEQTLMSYRLASHSAQLEDHETRLIALEPTIKPRS